MTDRTTSTRGPDQQAWPEPTAPSGRRVPGARRERKPVLALVAVLLIAVGALGGYYLVSQNSQRVDAIEIIANVPQGQQIPVSAMAAVQVPANSSLPYVPYADASQVAGTYAATSIEPGTLLSHPMYSASSAASAGQAVVGLALKDGQYPDSLQAGQKVGLYQLPTTAGSGASCPGTTPGSLITSATVINVSAPAGAGSADVEVAVGQGVAGEVACNSSGGTIAVSPGGGPSATVKG